MSVIIHLTDLHFGAGRKNQISFSDVKRHFIEYINKLTDNPIIVVSGDITYQAMQIGYSAAHDFFEDVIAKTEIDPIRFIFCPGNHDIDPDLSFNQFTAFCYSIRKDKQFDFSLKPSVSIVLDDIYFIVSNSSQHRNKDYGLVDLDRLKAEIETLPHAKQRRIAIQHHHLLPIIEADTSVIRNAYHYLNILDANDISAILHGHQHFNVGFPIGANKMRIFGGASFGFATEGVVNSFNVYHVEAAGMAVERIGLSIDGPVAGHTGFIRMGERLVV
ncbi:metallophosphoesterase [Rhizobium leguminosarum]|uniref:metallophosphoesterase family protein n=1 Tax=Rhizobium leguminosarum TaxID=384 RepID=UPI001C958360|nr:metallophosphoesterase [Rhizobium leguminosarum]MBY5367395.1 metallophosphoesterase [Rhizobium leguminosarum]MBY5449959.1 metallophosphoesterase [Rhizobium leguminosarum]